MLDLSPDVVLETATADAVRSYAKEVLDRGIDLIVLSSGALLDERLLTEMKQLALRTGAMIYVPSGAIGGIDLVRAAAASADSSIRIRTSKPPQGLADAPYVKNLDVNLDTQAVIFSGGVRDAIRGFPKNVNVAASLALAAHDPECLRIEVEVCPDLQHNMHSITLESVFGSAEIIVRSRPMKNNPRSSLLAALSCIALLKRLQQPLQVC
jgi:aspartate dehydrogenase